MLIRYFFLLVLGFLLSACGSTSKPKLSSPAATFEDGIKPETAARVQSWKKLIAENRNQPAHRQLAAANDFINQFAFVDDRLHWQQADYWATPLQTIVTQAGDCEDFALAKYYTLTRMGMPVEQLRLTYVKALTLNQAHMVVSYYAQKNAMPLVLDNLDRRILPATSRQDLLPVYSFNETGLWLDKANTSDYIDDSSRISLWQQLQTRLRQEQGNESAYVCQYQYRGGNALAGPEQCPD
ncbi:hypothetical protein Q7C_1312 [Methylophaga frappieri]|uniref:Periplasmic protein n=1 Tax=Methylophaga frappieri (strain ATCC BAA-2434 / DSM 25690 / JAM7) TaxID=754477 RepID=I1YHR9_METFJ|nr:transglutaminase-like cysteine peptidase [Methylophaga frappieri]AFJ02462.1 hypothetical protein Q7C_1312 [Methylophaga frappieri]